MLVCFFKNEHQDKRFFNFVIIFKRYLQKIHLLTKINKLVESPCVTLQPAIELNTFGWWWSLPHRSSNLMISFHLNLSVNGTPSSSPFWCPKQVDPIRLMLFETFCVWQLWAETRSASWALHFQELPILVPNYRWLNTNHLLQTNSSSLWQRKAVAATDSLWKKTKVTFWKWWYWNLDELEGNK